MTPFRCKIGLTLRRKFYHRNHAALTATLRSSRNSHWACRWLPAIAVLILMLATATDSFAQQPAGEGLSDVQRLIRNTIEGRELETELEIARAAEMLVNVELFDDAKAMLVKLQALQLDDAQLLELTTQVGSAFFAEIYVRPELQPIGQAVGDYVLRGAQKGLQSPERYDSLLSSLNSDDASARNKAVRQLRTIGEPAMANVLNAFTQDDRVEDFPGLRGALKALAFELPEPILAGAVASDPQVKLESIRALENVDSKEATSALYLAILMPNQNDLIRSTALDILTNRPGASIDSVYIEQWFQRETVEALRAKRDPALVRQSSQTWIWNSDLQKIVSQPSNVATDRCRTASYFARGLYESNPLSKSNRELFLLTQLELAKRVAGPHTPVNSSKLTKVLGLSAGETNQLLQLALKRQLFPAATACCEIIKSMGDVSVLSERSGSYPPLTHAILSGDRNVQFAALDAINQLDPKQAFPGSSYVVTLAVYLASGSGQPAALVGHHRVDIAQTYAASIASSGLRGEAAKTGRSLFQIATASSDVEIIVISDTITNPSYAGLIQQLRSDWRTSKIPIALLYSDARQGQRAELRLKRSNVTVLPFNSDPALIATSVDQVVEKVATFRQDRVERNRQAKVAIRWLAKVATNREDYRFFDLGRHQEKIQQLIYQPGFLKPVTEILSSIPSPESQRKLLDFASENAMPIPQRQLAVEAFQSSVKRSGILLTTDEIMLQYNRYNSSEAEPKDTQQLLGSVLDIIESGKR